MEILLVETYWEVKKDNKVYSPLTTRRLQRWIYDGRITGDDLVWRRDFSGWKKVSEVKALKPGLKVPEEKAEE